jgi:transposase
VVKIKTAQQILCCRPRPGFEDSRADVSFIAGLLMDKFAWHIPLYRQHQRLQAGGIRRQPAVADPDQPEGHQPAGPDLRRPVRLDPSSRVKAMDETPIKAGRSGHGKMHTGYFWPIYGELDEVCFPFHTSRSHDFVCTGAGSQPRRQGRVLLTDGFAAYEQYAEKTGMTHAQCWAHTRRHFRRA